MEEPTEITPISMPANEARRWWRELVRNSATLLEDAWHVHELGSYGRARSLAVLAREELAKALWIYRAAKEAWSCGEPSVTLPPEFEKNSANHRAKLVEALVHDAQLEEFWGMPAVAPDEALASDDGLLRHLAAAMRFDAQATLMRKGAVDSPSWRQTVQRRGAGR